MKSLAGLVLSTSLLFAEKPAKFDYGVLSERNSIAYDAQKPLNFYKVDAYHVLGNKFCGVRKGTDLRTEAAMLNSLGSNVPFLYVAKKLPLIYGLAMAPVRYALGKKSAPCRELKMVSSVGKK